jgi:CpeT protein
MRASLLTLILLPLSGSAADSDVKAVVELLTGSFSSAKQAKADTAYFDVRLHMSPIFTDKAGEHWLYVEQAMATALDKPYRQRVYKVELREGSIISRVFTLPGDAHKFAGGFKDPKKFADLKADQLVERAGCAIVLAKQSDGTFKGSTLGKGCASDLRGAKYATSEVTLSPKLLTSWDRGYDADGKQVWGAVSGPYQFDKE